MVLSPFVNRGAGAPYTSTLGSLSQPTGLFRIEVDTDPTSSLVYDAFDMIGLHGGFPQCKQLRHQLVSGSSVSASEMYSRNLCRSFRDESPGVLTHHRCTGDRASSTRGTW